PMRENRSLALPGSRFRATQFFLRIRVCLGVSTLVALCACARVGAQESGTQAGATFNNGAELVVNVHDEAGVPLAATAMVHVYRDGATPSGQTVTSDGRAIFVLSPLGEFTVVVEAAGYQSARKDVSLPTAQRTQIDVALRKDLSANGAVVVAASGRPLLAPKAKEAFEKGLQALSAEKWKDAEKFVGEAMRLAPGHPDVLYARGVLYLKEREWAKAQQMLEKAAQIDPSHARAFA